MNINQSKSDEEIQQITTSGSEVESLENLSKIIEPTDSFLVYRGNGVFNFTRDLYLKLFKSSNLPSGFNADSPGNEEDSFSQILPEELHLYIFQFLSPIEIIRTSFTCRSFYLTCSDLSLWRTIAKNYDYLFISEQLEVVEYSRTLIVVGLQADLENQIKKLREEKKKKKNIIENNENININIDNENNENNQNKEILEINNLNEEDLLIEKSNEEKSNEEKSQNEEKSRQNSQTIRIFSRSAMVGSFQRALTPNSNTITKVGSSIFPVPLSTKEKRIEYIDLVEDPYKILISKIKETKNTFKKHETQMSQRQHQLEIQMKNRKIQTQLVYFISILLCLGQIGFFIFLFLLDFRIEQLNHIKFVYMILPVLAIVIAVIGLLIRLMFFVERDDAIFLAIVISLFASVDLFSLLAALRADEIIKWDWAIIFVPIYLIFVILCFISYFILRTATFSGVMSILMLVDLIVGFAFLILKIDSKWNVSYTIIFIPFYIYLFFPCIALSCAASENCPHSISEDAFVRIAKPFLALNFPIIVFLCLLNSYLENYYLNHFSYVMIPLYFFFLLTTIASLSSVVLWTIRIISRGWQANWT
ncbi:transmembrane protein [Anaeramoeba ignava]|uniref:Transmembrane protein n=1 Tax=Anaeramoeba ignava TaxID=1746090 RepID=A0A9Q0LCU1_ANAIG|nr:transmembrane protein [Anaeramoeba ignava]